MADHCDACGNKLPKGHVSTEEQERRKKIDALLQRRKELEQQLSEISRELARLGYSG